MYWVKWARKPTLNHESKHYAIVAAVPGTEDRQDNGNKRAHHKRSALKVTMPQRLAGLAPAAYHIEDDKEHAQGDEYPEDEGGLLEELRHRRGGIHLNG